MECRNTSTLSTVCMRYPRCLRSTWAFSCNAKMTCLLPFAQHLRQDPPCAFAFSIIGAIQDPDTVTLHSTFRYPCMPAGIPFPTHITPVFCQSQQHSHGDSQSHTSSLDQQKWVIGDLDRHDPQQIDEPASRTRAMASAIGDSR